MHVFCKKCLGPQESLNMHYKLADKRFYPEPRLMSPRVFSWWSQGYLQWLQPNRGQRSSACCWNVGNPNLKLINHFQFKVEAAQEGESGLNCKYMFLVDDSKWHTLVMVVQFWDVLSAFLSLRARFDIGNVDLSQYSKQALSTCFIGLVSWVLIDA